MHSGQVARSRRKAATSLATASNIDRPFSAVAAVGLPIAPLPVWRSVRLKTRLEGASTDRAEVTWKLSPEVGEISSSGIYVAPEADAPAVVQITAVLKADPTKTATALIRLKKRAS